MRNVEIRRAAKERSVHLWEIAEALGIADATFSRRLRRELPEPEKQKIFGVIEKLKGGDNSADADNLPGSGLDA